MLLTISEGTFRTFQLTDDMNVADVSHHVPESVLPDLAKAYKGAGTGAKYIKKKLDKWIDRYPDLPNFKNFLTGWYSARKEHEKSFAYNREVMEQHPDYFYAKLNLAKEYLYRRKPEKVPEALGAVLELQELYPERKVFYIDEYSAFYKTIVEYWCAMGAPEQAEAVLKRLRKTEKQRGSSLLLYPAYLLVEKTKEENGIEILTERTEPTLPQTTEDPVFHSPEILWLYENGFDISTQKLKALLSLERSILIPDLETVIYDAIKRYAYFSKEGAEAEETDFCLHALYLLKELGATESLPVILELLRQPDDVLDFWLGDLLTENIWQVVYTLGKERIDVLENFLQEPLNYTFARSLVSTAVSQMALHHPERRPQIINSYQRLLTFYLENRENEQVTDPTLVGLIISNLINLKAGELEGEIKIMYEEDMVDESINDDWEEVTSLLKGNSSKLQADPKQPVKNIAALYDDVQKFGAFNGEMDEEWEDDPVEEVALKEGTLFYAADLPYVREEQKVGRNDPYPCGSGLKYKKCHGKNE